MNLELPSESKVMQNWKWNEYKPYFEDLLNQNIDKTNVNAWMKYWSDFSELIGEVGTEVYVATTVDTTDEDAKNRFNTFLEDVSENASSKNQALRKKLLDSGCVPNNFEIPLRSINLLRSFRSIIAVSNCLLFLVSPLPPIPTSTPIESLITP